MQCNTSPPCSPSGCSLWPVECWSTPLQWLWHVAGYRQELGHAGVNLLNGWHVQWVCWDVFSFQGLLTAPGNMGLGMVVLQHEVTVADEWNNNGPQDFITPLPSQGHPLKSANHTHVTALAMKPWIRPWREHLSKIPNAMTGERFKSPRARRACRRAKENDEKSFGQWTMITMNLLWFQEKKKAVTHDWSN